MTEGAIKSKADENGDMPPLCSTLSVNVRAGQGLIVSPLNVLKIKKTVRGYYSALDTVPLLHSTSEILNSEFVCECTSHFSASIFQ